MEDIFAQKEVICFFYRKYWSCWLAGNPFVSVVSQLIELESIAFQMEEGEFKNWTEKMQARLMSSSVDTPQQLQSVFESLIAKKQSLCEVLQAWNSR